MARFEPGFGAARALNAQKVATVHAALVEGCPVEPWPYGNATSINPLLVTLGPSPGGSPDLSVPDPALRPLDLPTVGLVPDPAPYLRSREPSLEILTETGGGAVPKQRWCGRR